MGFLSNIGNGAATVASTAGNVIENGGDAIIDTAEDVVATAGDGVAAIPGGINDVAASTGNPVVAGAGAIVGGFIVGIVNFARDVGHSVANVLRDILGVAGGLLRGDFGYALTRFVDFLFDLFCLALAIGRLVTGAYVIGAIVRYWERNELRAFVEDLLARTFGGDSFRLNLVRSHVRLTGGTWGLPIQARHRRFMLDSETMDGGPTPLWSLHQSGTIDLYALAGLWSSDHPRNSIRVWPHDTPTSVVYIVNPDGSDGMRADRFFLSHYINDSKHPGHFRVYSMSRRAIAERLQVASDKCELLGVKLSWNDAERFSWMMGYASFEITTPAEMVFDIRENDNPANGDIISSAAGSYLIDKGLRSRVDASASEAADARAEDGKPIAFAVFQYHTVRHTTAYGYTAGRAIAEGGASSPCATAGRTDSCCNRIARMTVPPTPAPPARRADPTPLGSGVFHRDFWPNFGARYILAHEMGHYLGLCHFGHAGLDNIMFTPNPLVGLVPITPGMFLSYWLYSEPKFTLDDGKNAWRFLVNQMPHFL